MHLFCNCDYIPGGDCTYGRSYRLPNTGICGLPPQWQLAERGHVVHRKHPTAAKRVRTIKPVNMGGFLDDGYSSSREGARTFSLLAHENGAQAYALDASFMYSTEAYLLSDNSGLPEAAIVIDDDYLIDIDELGRLNAYPENVEDYESEGASSRFRPSAGEVSMRLSPEARLDGSHHSNLPTPPSSTSPRACTPPPVSDLTRDTCADFVEVESTSGVRLAQGNVLFLCKMEDNAKRPYESPQPERLTSKCTLRHYKSFFGPKGFLLLEANGIRGPIMCWALEAIARGRC
ncbi:unnamed protein product [Dibothriocephalus latus]|uniref:Uncharacterized protein n=1 Tax=Dibothriocephalus latus TaxID=60516 RepID=A0A3P7MQH7_DIBLA|nr:unnamed protein product [Dibothriocephalus latus]